MNILKHEFSANLKTFLFWMIGLFVLVFVGMTKYSGIESAAGSNSLNELMDKFPKIILALFGMVGVDVNSLPGYYSIIAFYLIICAVLYAIHLGTNVVSREMIDKTYEFVFTKPTSRSNVLFMKLIPAWTYLLLFSLFNFLFSYIAVESLGLEVNINKLMFLYTIVIFLVSSIFLALGFFLSAIMQKAEKGGLYANLVFLAVFILAILYDMIENGAVLKLLTPFKYFEAKDLINLKFDLLYVVICIVLTAVMVLFGFMRFQKKDLK